MGTYRGGLARMWGDLSAVVGLGIVRVGGDAGGDGVSLARLIQVHGTAEVGQCAAVAKRVNPSDDKRHGFQVCNAS